MLYASSVLGPKYVDPTKAFLLELFHLENGNVHVGEIVKNDSLIEWIKKQAPSDAIGGLRVMLVYILVLE